jgi:membrane-associated protease RseP (regulator of RpoE activity)
MSLHSETEELEGSAFSRFMASNGGRVARVALGATIIGTGLTVVGGGAGLAIAAFGLVPIATGVFNLCPVAPVWGGHFIGAKYCGTRTPKQ